MVPPLDGAAAYVMTRESSPARIVEVGLRTFTRFFARAVTDGNLVTSITAIDPVPRAEIGKLDVQLIRESLQRAGRDRSVAYKPATC